MIRKTHIIEQLQFIGGWNSGENDGGSEI